MRFSPIKILQGLLCSTPLLVLLLAACGGGGGGTTSAPVAAYYTLSVNVTGITATSGVVLRNNGGDDLTATTPSVYSFATKVLSGTGYDVTVLTQPSSPVQLCKVTGPSGTMPASNLTLGVNCVDAYTISGTISGDPTIAVSGIGPILQNNNGDDLFIPTLPASGVAANFIFSIPVASGVSYTVTQLSRAKSPGQNCDGTNGSVITNGSGTVSGANITNVSIQCVSAPIVPRFAYVTNSTAKTVSAYTVDAAASGVLTATTTTATGSEPYSVSVDPTGRFAYVANRSSNNISAYSIDAAASGVLVQTDTNGAISDTQYTIAAGTNPVSVTVHPSGKFAYVANQTSNSISVYSIDTTTGALSAIDADDATTGTQASIATGATPYAVTIDPTGYFAYVANYGNGDGVTPGTISAYSINQTSGALTSLGSPILAGVGPSSIAIDPYDKFLLVTDNFSSDIMSYTITNGVLSSTNTMLASGLNPRSVAIDPNTGVYAYVANANNGGVSTYAIDPTSGVLTLVNTLPAGAAPISVNVDPSGQFVYVANFGTTDSSGVTVISGSVSAYSIGTGGALTELAGSPFVTAASSNSTSVTTTQ